MGARSVIQEEISVPAGHTTSVKGIKKPESPNKVTYKDFWSINNPYELFAKFDEVKQFVVTITPHNGKATIKGYRDDEPVEIGEKTVGIINFDGKAKTL